MTPAHLMAEFSFKDIATCNTSHIHLGRVHQLPKFDKFCNTLFAYNLKIRVSLFGSKWELSEGSRSCQLEWGEVTTHRCVNEKQIRHKTNDS